MPVSPGAGASSRLSWLAEYELIHAVKLAVVPAGDLRGHELESHSLGRLGTNRLHKRVTEGAYSVALVDLAAELGHHLGLAVNRSVCLDHYAAQFLVAITGLDLQGGAIVTFEVAGLL